MPWPESILVFALALGPALVLAIILHEAGHVLAAKCVGLRVATWGIGVRRPWYYQRVGSTTFYLGWPMTMGLTLCVWGTLEIPRRLAFMIVGGPMASLMGLAGGIGTWLLGAPSDVLLAWIAISFLFVISSAVPFEIKSEPVRLQNDASLLIDLLVRGRLAKQRLGPTLSSFRALAELQRAVKSELGFAAIQCIISILEAACGNVAAARESLAAALDFFSGERRPLSSIAFVQALIAFQEADEDAERVFAESRENSRGDDTAQFAIDCLHWEYRHRRGADIKHELEELRQRATEASRPSWLSMVELLEFEAHPSDDDEARCRDLLKKYPRDLASMERTRLLAVTTERLAARGEHSKARTWFAEAQAAIAAEAATIASVATRETFVRIAAAPLQRALQTDKEAIPLFISDNQPVTAAHGTAFAKATFFLSIVAAVAAVIRRSMYVFRGASSNPVVTDITMLVITLCFVLGLLTALGSVLYRERRWRPLIWAVAIILLALAIGFPG